MIKDTGGEASCIAPDVSLSRQVEMMVGKTVETYERLDCAFNNAGIEGEFRETILCTEENFDRVIAIDLKAVCSQSPCRSEFVASRLYEESQKFRDCLLSGVDLNCRAPSFRDCLFSLPREFRHDGH